jgi:ABC-type multidrug transport system fused ATPase/permease subunit
MKRSKKTFKKTSKRIKGGGLLGPLENYETYSVPFEPTFHTDLSKENMQKDINRVNQYKDELTKELTKQIDLKNKNQKSIDDFYRQKKLIREKTSHLHAKNDFEQRKSIIQGFWKFLEGIAKVLKLPVQILGKIIASNAFIGFMLFIIVIVFVVIVVFGKNIFQNNTIGGISSDQQVGGVSYENRYGFDFLDKIFVALANVRHTYNRFLYWVGLYAVNGRDRDQYTEGRWDNVMYMKVGKMLDSEIILDDNTTKISNVSNNIYSIVRPKPILYNALESEDLNKLPPAIKDKLKEDYSKIEFRWDKIDLGGDLIKYYVGCNSYNASDNPLTKDKDLSVFQRVDGNNNTCKYKEYSRGFYTTQRTRLINADKLDNFEKV